MLELLRISVERPVHNALSRRQSHCFLMQSPFVFHDIKLQTGNCDLQNHLVSFLVFVCSRFTITSFSPNRCPKNIDAS